MKKLFSFIFRQAVAVVLIVVFVLAIGIYSTSQMAINLLPDINVPMICVQVIYPGANAKSVEADVTVALEEGLSAISGVTSVDSYSYDNLSAVVLSFDYGTDTTEKQTDIKNKLSSIDLPDNITTSVYDIDLNAEALAKLSVTSDKTSSESENLGFAYAAASELAAKLTAIDGVESVEIKGGAVYSYLIQPFIGLELISPLLVEAFSYGALDLPLGNVTEDGSSVQIRNDSDVACVEDIENMPVALPSSIVALLTSVKQVMGYYEDSTTEELEKLRDDLDGGVIQVLGELDEMSSDDVGNFAQLKTYMNIASTYSAEQLRSFKKTRYYNEIYNQVTDPGETDDDPRTPKSDEELDELAEDIKTQYPAVSAYISSDMLKVVRDGKIDTLISFRDYIEDPEINPAYDPDSFYTLSDDDYFILETMFVKVYSDTYDYDDPDGLSEEESEEIRYNIDFAKKTSATGLANIADKKRDAEEAGEPAYDPSNEECALLFTATELSEEHPIVMSSTFMAFVRSDNYEYNMQLLIDSREGLGEDIDAAGYYGVYSRMKLEGVFEFVLSEELFGFIIQADLAQLRSDGAYVARVSDIATVVTDEEYSSYVYFSNGTATLTKSAIIEIYKSNGANSSAVVESVKAIFAEYAAEDTQYSVTIKLLDDQSEFISDSISNVLVSMLIGGLLAVIVIFLFLKKVRLSLIIAVTMPLSVLAALICLALMGITLNMVSLGGLAVGIGMLVDNSIVVIESISKHRDMDKTAFEAAVDGTVEVGGALFGSTLTTVCVFIPIIFTGGLTAEIFTDLSWAVIYSLAFSLLVAVTVIPTLYALFGRRSGMLKGGRLSDMPSEVKAEVADAVRSEEPKAEKKAFRRKLQTLKEPRIMNGVTSFYSKVLPAVLNKKLITIITAVVVFAASLCLLFLTGTEFLPSIDKGQIEINMTYGSTAQLEEVEADVFSFAETVRDNIDNIDYISVSVGKNGLLALTDTGIITVRLTTNRGTSKVVESIRELANSEATKPAGSVTVKEIDGVVASLMSGASDMSVTIVGDDGDTLKEIASKIMVKFESNGFFDVTSTSTESSTEYDLKFDRNKMAELGIDYYTTVLTLRIGIASYTACTVTIDGEDYGLNVKFADGAVTDLESLKNFVVGSDGGTAVKLSEICTVEKVVTEACIRRTDGKQMISVSANKNTDTGSASSEMQKLAAEVLAEYDGYSFEASGISSYLTDAFNGLAVALAVSFFLLYAVMAVQFGSGIKPLIIMASIPFSFTGGFIALVVTGTSLNVVSFIGLIMLMGVVVNNAIVMLEKIKQLYDSGMSHYTAVQEACKTRLRPILMTTLTTILALIPMAIGVGQGSELMQPLGIVVIGGLLIGTLVTLVLVPAVYCAVHRLSAKTPDGRKKSV